MSIIIELPKWKVYLYTLIQRFNLLKKINTNGITGGVLIRKTLKQWGKTGVIQRQTKVFQVLEFLSLIEKKQTFCSKKELKTATNLQWLKNFNLGEVMFEISEIKKFGAEVGLERSDMRGLSEKDLICKIIENIDADKSYSTDFVEFYEKVSEEYPEFFNDENGDDKKEINLKELETAIEDVTKLSDLREIYNDDDYEEVFDSSDLKKIKDPDELKEAMLDAIVDFKKSQKKIEKEEEKEEEEKPKRGRGRPKKVVEEVKEEKKEEILDEETKETMISIIQDAEKLSELEELVNDEDYEEIFSGIKIKKSSDIDDVKEKMLKKLGLEVEKKEEKKTPTSKEMKKKIAEWEDMGFTSLKTEAVKLGVKASPSLKRAELIEKMVEKLEGIEVEEETAEIEIDQTMIKDMVKAKDDEALIKIGKKLGITFKSIEKHSVKKMGEKIINFLEENIKKESKPKKKTKESVFDMVYNAVKEESSDDDIEEIVFPILREKGLSKLEAKKRINQLIEIAKIDLEISSED